MEEKKVDFQKSGINNKLIDQDNLKSNESIGTFRWNDSIKLLDIPIKLVLNKIISFQKGIQTVIKISTIRMANLHRREILREH